MKARSKFYGIDYPLFGLKNKPFNWTIRTDSIALQLIEFGDWYTIDKFKNNASLASRYIEAKDDNFCFNYTCLNINQLISKPIAWGIDSKAKIYNLSNKQDFKAKNVAITRLYNNYIWVENVSYPFKIPTNILDRTEIINQRVTIVYIDDIWVLHKFTSFKEEITSLKI